MENKSSHSKFWRKLLSIPFGCHDAAVTPLKAFFWSFFYLSALTASSCGDSSYEKYNACYIRKMENQDISMMHPVEEFCEIKHPYEKQLPKYTRSIDIDFGAELNEVIFIIANNDTNYEVTRTFVSGHYLSCDKIPKKPKSPKPLYLLEFQEEAKQILGITVSEGDEESELSKFLRTNKRPTLETAKVVESEKLGNDHLEMLKENTRMYKKQIELNRYNRKVSELEMQEVKKKLERSKRNIANETMIREKSKELLKIAEEKENEAYQLQLKEYQKAVEGWSLPVEIMIKNNRGKTEFSNFKNPRGESAALMRFGPQCMRYVKYYGKRVRK